MQKWTHNSTSRPWKAYIGYRSRARHSYYCKGNESGEKETYMGKNIQKMRDQPGDGVAHIVEHFVVCSSCRMQVRKSFACRQNIMFHGRVEQSWARTPIVNLKNVEFSNTHSHLALDNKKKMAMNNRERGYGRYVRSNQLVSDRTSD